jgi:SAM-dependent methyltransferase
VLEHLEEPEAAIRECHRVLRPGGTAIYTVPFIWHLHEEPRDFFRYSKYGLRYLFEKVGFEIVELRALSGFWVTFGQLFVYNLYRSTAARCDGCASWMHSACWCRAGRTRSTASIAASSGRGCISWWPASPSGPPTRARRDPARHLPEPAPVCGIVGIVNVARRPVPPTLVGRMADCLAHRGPDDEGYLLADRRAGRRAAYAGRDTHPAVAAGIAPLSIAEYAPDLALGHRRFSIIDPTPAGHQPFVDAAGTCAVVFNGEIYNYVELRDELAADGVQFRTDTDTEVLVEAYKRWGAQCFGRFNGFWALALYEFASGRLILSRDRLGKKPLFWTRIDDTVYFASEIKALLSVPEVGARRRVNETAAFQWLAYGRKDLGGQTSFDGIRAFPPARGRPSTRPRRLGDTLLGRAAAPARESATWASTRRPGACVSCSRARLPCACAPTCRWRSS